MFRDRLKREKKGNDRRMRRRKKLCVNLQKKLLQILDKLLTFCYYF